MRESAMSSNPMRFEIFDLARQNPAFEKSADEIKAAARLLGLNCFDLGASGRFLKLSGGHEQKASFDELFAFINSIPYHPDQEPDPDGEI
jgi:hypothetical protein